jgi:hypothetical protein
MYIKKLFETPKVLSVYLLATEIPLLKTCYYVIYRKSWEIGMTNMHDGGKWKKDEGEKKKNFRRNSYRQSPSTTLIVSSLYLLSELDI